MTRRHKYSFPVLALLACSVAIADESSLRLAGIIAPENGQALALIELPNGEQELFKVGESIQDGLVVEISASLVRLEMPQGDIVLQLEGTGDPVPPMDYTVKTESTGAPKIVDPQDLRAVSQLAETAEVMDSKELASRVLAHLNLANGARIMAIDDQPVESTPDAVRRMAATIDAKSESDTPFKFVVSVDEVSGSSRVYIFADSEGKVTKRTIPSN